MNNNLKTISLENANNQWFQTYKSFSPEKIQDTLVDAMDTISTYYANCPSDLERYSQAVQNALHRLENGTFGICVKSGKLIPDDEIKKQPYKALSNTATEEQQKFFENKEKRKSIPANARVVSGDYSVNDMDDAS
ncbi:MAG: hypothetical protein U9Q15_02165 [Patescibacteria group bacterium]|nr:hypothetical protein [Patescibacteria group bacterium]